MLGSMGFYDYGFYMVFMGFDSIYNCLPIYVPAKSFREFFDIYDTGIGTGIYKYCSIHLLN